MPYLTKKPSTITDYPFKQGSSSGDLKQFQKVQGKAMGRARTPMGPRITGGGFPEWAFMMPLQGLIRPLGAS